MEGLREKTEAQLEAIGISEGMSKKKKMGNDILQNLYSFVPEDQVCVIVEGEGCRGVGWGMCAFCRSLVLSKVFLKQTKLGAKIRFFPFFQLLLCMCFFISVLFVVLYPPPPFGSVNRKFWK